MIERVGIVGLGLMGGSLAKAIRAQTSCQVFGFDIDQGTMEAALSQGVLAGELGREELASLDLLVVALFPQDTVDYIRQAAEVLRPGTLVCDLCGVKAFVQEQVGELCRSRGLSYIGCHPMAGRECWGYAHTDAGLFQGASMILCPGGAKEEELRELEGFWLRLGFGRCVRTSVQHHDRMISYTSQLAHVLSNAYVKNPASREFSGYTGGSFQDLTRVAKLNPTMWSELFLCNRENLLRDTRRLIEQLEDYAKALEQGNGEALFSLLQEGSRIKEQLLEEKEKQA